LLNLNVSTNCWICEGWTNIKFRIPKNRVKECLSEASENEQYKASVLRPGGKFQLTLYCSYDNYKPHHMNPTRDAKGNEGYSIALMIPPGSLNYFY